MDRRTFLKLAGAALIAPSLPTPSINPHMDLIEFTRMFFEPITPYQKDVLRRLQSRNKVVTGKSHTLYRISSPAIKRLAVGR